MPESGTHRTSWLTLPNCLSLSRVALVAPLAWSLTHGSGVATIVVFILAILSDVVDGRLARRARQDSRVGTLLDHGSDAIFVAATSAVCAALGLLPPLLPPLIAAAFIQYLLDSRVPTGGNFRRSRLGRWNGIAYFVIVGLAIVVHHFLPEGRAAVQTLGWLLVATTLASMATRAAESLHARNAS